jgi:glycosyltransferase involved in cell wall biosynthesis
LRPDLALIGHPFAPIGMGEHVRCSFRAFRSVARKPALIDLYGMSDAAASGTLDLVPFASTELGSINVFHINADEVELAFATLGDRIPKDAYNIVYPAWELASFPDPWIAILERFDEAWAPSAFIADALREKLSKPVVEMPLATEVLLESFLSRRYFGIAEDAYVFLFFYDFRSYASRKNPRAVLDAFRRTVAARPYCNARLVIKTHGGDDASSRALLEEYADIASRIAIIERTMTDNEVKNLVRCADAFVSLHRSEGYGRGMAEAMYLGKPVVATGYSGNMTFMTASNSHPIGYSLVPLEPESYPFWQDQVWAEPDIAAAADKLIALIDDPEAGRALGRKASIDIRRELSYRATGTRFVRRIDEIAHARASGTPDKNLSTTP